MPTLADLWPILSGGGALGIAVFVIFAFIRGWLVPGFIYTATVKRLDKSVEANEANSAALDRLTDEIRDSRIRRDA